RAMATSFCSSAAVLTEPDSVTTPLKVSTSIFMPPTSGSFSRAVLTRVVIVASSIVSPTVFPQDVASTANTSRNAISTGERVLRIMGRAPGLSRSKLHARDVIAAVDHEHLASDAARGRSEKEAGGVGDLRRLDIAPERSAIAVD